MNPFFFGSSSHPLYGVYHPQKSEQDRNEGVVLCHAFGQEYMRSHRAYRQLAMMLSKKGYHVLRFDYRGTGDSAGDVEDVVAADWLEDIGVAMEELKDTADIQKVSLIGLRLGASLAASVSSQRKDVENLVLWDPILSGSAYEDELKNEITKKESGSNFIDSQGSMHINGFELSKSFIVNLKEIVITNLVPQAKSVLQVVSHENQKFTDLKNAWAGHKGFQYEHAAAPGDWNYVDEFGGILIPQPVIQAIVNWF